MMDIDVLVIGRSCLDYLAVLNRFPEENQKTTFELRLTEGGGQGGTASCCIAKLGGRVAYVGKLGDDQEGRYCLKRLRDFGVSTEFVEIIAGGTTPVAYIFITKTTGQRTIIYEPNSLPKIEMTPALGSLLDQSAVLLLDPETTYFGQELKERGDGKIKIVYDCESWRDGIEDIMPLADFFIPSSDFLKSKELNLDRLSLAEGMTRLNPAVAGELIVTDGENGAYYYSNERLHHVPAPKIKAIDTTGAGDNFHAAFALALSRGFNLHRAVRFSVAVASLSCREYGGRKGLPDWQEAIEAADALGSIPLPY